RMPPTPILGKFHTRLPISAGSTRAGMHGYFAIRDALRVEKTGKNASEIVAYSGKRSPTTEIAGLCGFRATLVSFKHFMIAKDREITMIYRRFSQPRPCYRRAWRSA